MGCSEERMGLQGSIRILVGDAYVREGKLQAVQHPLGAARLRGKSTGKYLGIVAIVTIFNVVVASFLYILNLSK